MYRILSFYEVDMNAVREIVDILFSAYTILLFAVVIGSWFPNFQRSRVMQAVRFYVDPYLNLFRRIVPPIGGVLDLSPLLAFISLSILERIILSFLR